VGTSNATSPVVASAKVAPKSAAPKPKRDMADLQDRYTAAAQAAATYASLYDEGAVSRVDRDSRVAAAKQLQAELQATN
jgi:hypothetical protein